MIILSMPEDELNAHWDRIEAIMGEMPLGYPEPSVYLLRAVNRGLLTRDQALDLYMAAVGIATTDP